MYWRTDDPPRARGADRMTVLIGAAALLTLGLAAAARARADAIAKARVKAPARRR
jgi:hypothetical protein